MGNRIRLRPLNEADSEKLIGVARAEFFTYYVGPVVTEDTPESVRTFVADMLALKDMAFVVEIKETGQIVGMSSYLDIREEQRGVEIGRTWIIPEFRGTFVNPEMKFLMLEHAFEVLGCVRVQIKCDARNLQSAAAIQKLGAKPEGILRQHRCPPLLGLGDTAMFSILDTEWPEVKSTLLQRVAN